MGKGGRGGGGGGGGGSIIHVLGLPSMMKSSKHTFYDVLYSPKFYSIYVSVCVCEKVY